MGKKINKNVFNRFRGDQESLHHSTEDFVMKGRDREFGVHSISSLYHHFSTLLVACRRPSACDEAVDGQSSLIVPYRRIP